ncbi:YeeE/YedE family protein [Histomonas meleagridis]|uniref:YeeE/YedE family protein n=1 Tax=Histomonas meleagridis TaxID=135588 RepID=UPI003559716C|nr:YeeE/YedE family protein [Histomonas meleagridis]KAH0807065.1 YeeE/YedE family protein [Histomonas meleagridis]
MLSSGNFSQMRDVLMMCFFATLLFTITPVSKFHPLFYPDKESFSYTRASVGGSLVLGAILFGMGMQLGSGCATGTLVGMGEGTVKSWVVFVFFVAGATFGSCDPVYEWWNGLKAAGPVNLFWYGTLIILVVLFALCFVGDFVRIKMTKNEEFTLKSGRMLMTIGNDQDEEEKPMLKEIIRRIIVNFIIALCVYCFFICDGSTIGVMGVFAYVGADFLKIFKVDPNSWEFFKSRGGVPNNLMDTDIFISDCAIILGAFVASTLKKDFGCTQKNTIVEHVKGIFGGFLMGIGARMASGCNIGSMLSGITSFSLHGFIWMLSAIAGSAIVIYTIKLIDYLKERRNPTYQQL